MSINKKIEALNQKRKEVMLGGGEKAIEKQKEFGKLTARERIELLVDKGSFNEYDLFVQHSAREFGMADKVLNGDGVVIGTGTIDGRPICVFAQDFTVVGGSLGYMHAMKIVKIQDLALKMRVPCIGINDSGGAEFKKVLMPWRVMAKFLSQHTI